VNDLIARLQELDLLSKDLHLNEVSVEKNFTSGIVRRSNAMIVDDRVPTNWHGAVEPSEAMQSRIYRALQYGTGKPHP
jgi:hypothetical protein